ncbi:hypothetical protein Bca4012_027985 [Brassica carinata]|uniref:Uncharacterized protein n=1 Tax=Brassica carinata TaxID=52824 RepID=A0A8X7VKN0_BRACI|nr:hypothetical protein Bca52824_024985 [Brassica carinata]
MKKPNTEKLYDVEEEHYDILHYMVDVKSKEFGSLDKERAVRVLASMKQLRLSGYQDGMNCSLLFSLFGNVNASYEDGNMLSQEDCCKRSNAIKMDMVRNGLQHSPISRYSVVSFCSI